MTTAIPIDALHQEILRRGTALRDQLVAALALAIQVGLKQEIITLGMDQLAAHIDALRTISDPLSATYEARLRVMAKLPS